ncbi:NAD(P)-dependent oxidoreductase [Microbacterium aurantiacum]|uniref:NAD(P)-dependent oxidoreductase n=1 Tax=Microbacterium aurantiacum TaxID=162393 RepID=UPI0006AD27DE|nr:NAD(P)-dependent oxidoreductase [Microbacterium chocolatum]ANG84841.1 hypothetical protein A8L33_05085 [Microbacterium chocolatum]
MSPSTPSRPSLAFPDASPADEALLGVALASAGLTEAEIAIAHGVPADADEWVARIGDAEGILLGWGLPDDALRRLPSLRCISFLGTGAADHVNLELAEELGITVRTVRGYGDEAVAEHALALLLSAARRIPQLDSAMHAGRWEPVSGIQLSGKTLGVVGLGGIGSRLADIARGIGMRVVGWNRSVPQGPAEHDPIPRIDLPELFAVSDAVSLHLALTPETAGIIDADLVDAMKPGAILVNTARAGILDGDAVLRRVQRGEIVAALDVFDPEPLPTDDPWRAARGAVLTPHVAFDTPEASQALFTRAVANLVESLAADATEVDA